MFLTLPERNETIRRCENDPELAGCKELLAPTPLLVIEGYGDTGSHEGYGDTGDYEGYGSGDRC